MDALANLGGVRCSEPLLKNDFGSVPENYGAVLNCGRETSKAGGVTEAGSLWPEVAAEAYDGIEFVQFWLTETDL